MIEQQPDSWRGLQDRVAAILRECGFEAEVGSQLRLARGEVEIDVLPRDRETVPEALYLCECKSWHTNVPQAQANLDRYRRFLPPEVEQAATLRDLLEAIPRFSGDWLRETG